MTLKISIMFKDDSLTPREATRWEEDITTPTEAGNICKKIGERLIKGDPQTTLGE